MTLRQEIEKAVRELLPCDGMLVSEEMHKLRPCPCHAVSKVVDFTLAQVEKADRKAREECAALIENSLIRKVQGLQI